MSHGAERHTLANEDVKRRRLKRRRQAESLAPHLTPQLVHWAVQILIGGEWHVLEPALQRIVMPDSGPVDTQRRVDGRFNILGPDIAIAIPAGIGRDATRLIGRPDGAATLDPAAC